MQILYNNPGFIFYAMSNLAEYVEDIPTIPVRNAPISEPGSAVIMNVPDIHEMIAQSNTNKYMMIWESLILDIIYPIVPSSPMIINRGVVHQLRGGCTRDSMIGLSRER